MSMIVEMGSAAKPFVQIRTSWSCWPGDGDGNPRSAGRRLPVHAPDMREGRGMNYSPQEIIETIRMIRAEHLDIRTVTMGYPCSTARTPIPMRSAQDLREDHDGRKAVPVCETIEKELVSDRPQADRRHPARTRGRGIRRAASGRGPDARPRRIRGGVNFIGGFSALVHKGSPRRHRADQLPSRSAGRYGEGLRIGELATSKAGINMDAVAMMGPIIRRTAELTAADGSIGCAKLVVFCNVPEDNPSWRAPFMGSGGGNGDQRRVSGPGVVLHAVQESPRADFGASPRSSKRPPSRSPGWGTRRTDGLRATGHAVRDRRSLPRPHAGHRDSIAAILEEMGIERCGAPGRRRRWRS